MRLQAVSPLHSTACRFLHACTSRRHSTFTDSHNQLRLQGRRGRAAKAAVGSRPGTDPPHEVADLELPSPAGPVRQGNHCRCRIAGALAKEQQVRRKQPGDLAGPLDVPPRRWAAYTQLLSYSNLAGAPLADSGCTARILHRLAHRLHNGPASYTSGIAVMRISAGSPLQQPNGGQRRASSIARSNRGETPSRRCSRGSTPSSPRRQRSEGGEAVPCDELQAQGRRHRRQHGTTS
jgi:hypothetical protein